ncbi:MAG: DUF4440 domain-containing protein [Alphaproteobacteria bacterium]|nr:MAG: DUF4440 domain-containing protein [Alphaproteobacteria bacterium]
MKIRTTIPALLFSGVLFLGACSQPAEVDYQAEIEAGNAQFETYYNAGDAAGLDTLYTADAILLPPGGQAVSGAEARVAFWQGVMASGLASIDLIEDEVFGMGDTAIDRGQLIGYDADGNEIAIGKYLVVWKNEGGTWKLHRDIWNLDS